MKRLFLRLNCFRSDAEQTLLPTLNSNHVAPTRDPQLTEEPEKNLSDVGLHIISVGNQILSLPEISQESMPGANELAAAIRRAMALASTMESENGGLEAACAVLDVMKEVLGPMNVQPTPNDIPTSEADAPSRNWHTSAETIVKAIQSLERQDVAMHAGAPLKELTKTKIPTSSTNSPKPEQTTEARKSTIILDGAEKTVQATSKFTGLLPAPAGTLVGSMAELSLGLIKAIREKASNDENAAELVKHIADLIALVCQFLKAGINADSDTVVKALEGFSEDLESTKRTLDELAEQGLLKAHISHGSNKDTITQCYAKINLAYQKLQTCLAMEAARHLTGLTDDAAQREQTRLLSLLGDADTGVADKAMDPDDLLCLPGTRREVLGTIRQWVSDRSSARMMWISGVAGCGKSAVAATIARDLAASAIFHYSRTNDIRNRRSLCSIARQLSNWRDGALQYQVLNSVKQYQAVATAAFVRQFQLLIAGPLREVVDDDSPLLIVLDGLDEYADHQSAQTLIRLIYENDAHFPAFVKFIITSRSEAHLAKAFAHPKVQPAIVRYALDDVEPADVTRDIESFLNKRLEDIREGSEEPLGADWPGAHQVQTLVKLSGQLFQWAATAMRYIDSPGDPQSRLEAILARPNELQDLDSLYNYILASLFNTNPSPLLPSLLQHVLGCLATAPAPINLETMSYLGSEELGTVSHVQYVRQVKYEVLRHLGSLLIVPDDHRSPIRVLHPSILDFITDATRCRDNRFLVDISGHNATLARLCFRRMRRDLRRNICGVVEDPFVTNNDIPVQAIEDNIHPGLQYSCQYWGRYLRLSDGAWPNLELARELDEFCRRSLLHWLEVLGVLKMSSVAPVIVRDVEEWYKVSRNAAGQVHLLTGPWKLFISPPDHTLSSILYDLNRFILMSWKMIDFKVSEMYSSGVACTPSSSEFRRIYDDPTIPKYHVLRGPSDTSWSPNLWVAHGAYGLGDHEIVLSQNGKLVASQRVDSYFFPTGVAPRESAIRSLETGVGVGTPPENGRCIALFDQNDLLLYEGAEGLELWDLQRGSREGPAFTKRPDRTCFLPSNGCLAAGFADATIEIWSIEADAVPRQLQRWSAHGDGSKIVSLQLFADGQRLASASNRGELILWDTRNGSRLGSVSDTSAVFGMTICFNGRKLATVPGSTGGNQVYLWNVGPDSDLKLFCKLTAQGSPPPWAPTALRFSPDGHKLAAVGGFSIHLFGTAEGSTLGTLQVDYGTLIHCIEFSPDGKTIVSGSQDSRIRLWDVETQTLVSVLEGHTTGVTALAFTPNSSGIISGSMDRTTRRWDYRAALQWGDKSQPSLWRRVKQDQYIREHYPTKYLTVKVVDEDEKGGTHIYKFHPIPSMGGRALPEAVDARLGLDPVTNWVRASFSPVPWFWIPPEMAAATPFQSIPITGMVDIVTIYRADTFWVLDIADLLPTLYGSHIPEKKVAAEGLGPGATPPGLGSTNDPGEQERAERDGSRAGTNPTL